MSNPLDQFKVKSYFNIPIGEESFMNIDFTNSSLMMVLSVASIIIFFLFGLRKKSVIPNKMQLFLEQCYSLVVEIVEGNIGKKGNIFFPFVFCLFMFLAVSNVMGMFPYSFTVTSHIIVTFAIAMFIFFMVMLTSIFKNGLGFFRHFCPSGTPLFVLPLLTVIELFAYLARPVSLCLRMSANMIAGHVLLKVIAGLTSSMGVFFFVPLAFIVIMTGFEIFVALLQAYIFATLTCVYINDAMDMH